jgi:N-acetylglucosamine-6-phosphate deacetylase
VISSVVDGGGGGESLVLPGLVDLQVNGYADVDVWSAGPAELDRLGSTLAAAGTTSWCPTLVSRPLAGYGAWFDAHPGPAVGEVGLHLEGPFLTRPGAHRPSWLRPPDAGWLAGLPPRVRIVTLAPEAAGGLEAVAALAGRGVVVSLGHSDATYEQALAAADRGARLVTHVFNVMAPLHHRSPGLPGAALTDPRLTPAVIGDGAHVHPAILRLVLAAGPAVLVSDSVAWGTTVADGPLRLPDGTLAGSTITLADAVRVAVGAGVPVEAAAMAATATPARLLGLDDRGALAPGRRADVVRLDPALGVSGVWVGGRPVA